MQEQATAAVAAPCLTIYHHRCRGLVVGLYGDRPCACPCHDPAPVDPEAELEHLQDLDADRRLAS
jgi:hypothetical protein